jgi:hypothetical protein
MAQNGDFHANMDFAEAVAELEPKFNIWAPYTRSGKRIVVTIGRRFVPDVYLAVQEQRMPQLRTLEEAEYDPVLRAMIVDALQAQDYHLPPAPPHWGGCAIECDGDDKMVLFIIYHANNGHDVLHVDLRHQL